MVRISLCRCLGLAAMFVPAIAPASPQPVEGHDIAVLIERLAGAYRRSGVIEYEHTIYVLNAEPSTDHSGTPIEEIDQTYRDPMTQDLMFIISPEGSWIHDKTHPSQRRFARSPIGWVYHLGMYAEVMGRNQSIGGTLVHADQPRRGQASGSRNMAEMLPEMARWMASEDPTFRADRLAPDHPDSACLPGAVWRLSGTEYTAILRDDFSLIEHTYHPARGPTIIARVLRHHEPRHTRASLPEVIVKRTVSLAAGGEPVVHHHVVVQSQRRASTKPNPGAFEWWTYAGRLTDRSTKKIYGPGNVEIDPAKVEPVGLASNPDDLAMFVDERSLEAHAKDPSALVLPRRKWTPQPYLLVGGITLIVLGLAWALRRRFAA